MDCVNHMGVAATAYCQNCGKALCPACVRNAPGGLILCEPCLTVWQGFQQPFAGVHRGGPNPWVAAVIGLIPGVGAMYNGQFVKGLIHVVIFAVLVSAAHMNGIFGLFIAAWIVYQSFEAFHTAKALRDGEPPPDPLGLNEVSSWLNMGTRQQSPREPGAPPATPGAGMPGAPGQEPVAGTYTGAYQAPYTPPAGGPGAPYGDPNIPPGPLHFFRRREPVGAVVLIGLGLLFLLGQLDILTDRVFQLAWPLLLIGLGVWLIVRRMGEGQGGSR
jgi:TM2 domain-containing membrane protein YozV